MKKTFRTVAIALGMLFIGNEGQAQDLTFGPKVGYNNAKLEGSSFRDFHESNSINGMHIGVFAEIRFNKLAIQPEVYYSTIGGKWQAGFEDGNLDHNFNLDYVNVPLMFKYYLTNGIAIEAGPQAGFLMDGNHKFSDLDPDSPKFNEFDFSVNLGLSVNLPLNLMVSARYNAGLTNVVDHPDVDWKNRVLQLSVGYRF